MFASFAGDHGALSGVEVPALAVFRTDEGNAPAGWDIPKRSAGFGGPVTELRVPSIP
jgi:hypothetical protein